jgi:DNA repair protein RecO (recombination protein O)
MMRTGGKKNRAVLEPLSGVEVSFHHREKYHVQTAREVRFRPETSVMGLHPFASSVRLFLAEMLYKSLREESPDPELFDYIDSSLQFYASSEKDAMFHLLFLVKLTRFFGFFPKGNSSPHTPYFDGLSGEFSDNPNASVHSLDEKMSGLWSALKDAEYGKEPRVKPDEKRAMLRFIVDYYRLHLEGFGEVKSLPVLLDVFSA